MDTPSYKKLKQTYNSGHQQPKRLSKLMCKRFCENPIFIVTQPVYDKK